jgi:hypothetical protein
LEFTESCASSRQGHTAGDDALRLPVAEGGLINIEVLHMGQKTTLCDIGADGSGRVARRLRQADFAMSEIGQDTVGEFPLCREGGEA